MRGIARFLQGERQLLLLKKLPGTRAKRRSSAPINH